MIQQPWQGNELDKDIILMGNKEYHPDYCAFVPTHVNTAIHSTKRSNKHNLPLGVHRYFTNQGTRYHTTLMRHGLPTIRKGAFITPEETHAYYLNAKSDYLMYLAGTQQDPRVKAGLLAWASSFL